MNEAAGRERITAAGQSSPSAGSAAPSGAQRAAPESYAQKQFTGAKPFCDVVMKGGVTSGVVYPLAIVELATRYRFRNIGGTSAGAIAAAVAAAAEYARESGGFVRAAALAEVLQDRLLGLFQPHPRLRPLFLMILAMLREKRRSLKLARALLAAARGYREYAIFGAVPGVLIAILTWHERNGWALVTAILAMLIGSTLALGARLCRALVHDLPARGYGICPGLRQPGGRGPALTEWLADTFDAVAGIGPAVGAAPSKPLTFGDLIGDPLAPNINLEIMTTNLSAGRPHRLPFRRGFLFRVDEFEKLFPERIVRWLVEHSPSWDGDPAYHWLPAEGDLPVVVAVRLSLSFPLLLTAVPLYDPDFRFEDGATPERLLRCWFTDGGVCSNFPIHFFDSIWPRWPTFGISLEDIPEGRHLHRVWLPAASARGELQSFKRVDSLGSFLHGILNAMQGWRDHLQSTLPGYRERIVRIRLQPDEGGLHLDMPAGMVRELGELGRSAGRALHAFDWPAHRWRRYLIAMLRLEKTLEQMRRAYDPGATGEGLQTFLGHYESDDEYAQSPEWRAAARADAADLMQTAARWLERPPLRRGRIPKPEVDLRITPKV